MILKCSKIEENAGDGGTKVFFNNSVEKNEEIEITLVLYSPKEKYELGANYNLELKKI